MKTMKQKHLKSLQLNKPVNIMCESYRIREQVNEETGEIEAVFMEGVAITFGKPTRNRVSYTYESGIQTHKTLIGKPFLDTHNDSSIRTHPPFGHVVECNPGTNPKNGMPCLNYSVNIDPEERVFIRKAKRGDIPGTSIQVLVDEVAEMEDSYGAFLEANIREYLELSAVLIPGDGDTSIALAESFKKMKEKVYKEVDTLSFGRIQPKQKQYIHGEVNTSNGEGVITPDGVFPQKKVLAKEQEEESEEEQPLMPLPEQKHYEPEQQPDEDDSDIDKSLRFIGKRNTEIAFKGCNCPGCGLQMLKDNYNNGFQLRCWKCDYRINRITKEGKKMTVKAIRKEMGDYGGGMPSNNAPQAPAQQPMGNQQPMMGDQQQPEIPDHTHPEYDQMMVKLQEIESALHGMQMGGVQQEGLDAGKPENDKGKPTGNQQPVADNQGNDEPKKFESMIRKLVKEELKGMPERDIGKEQQPAGPDETQNTPQSQQPPNGEAPSGGGFDSDDKTNKEDGDSTAADATKPASEYDKLPIKKNKIAQAKSLIEKAKALMKEANEPDPSEPMPGKSEKEPEKMDGSVPSKNPTGGTEELGAGASEDPEANIPNEQRPKMKEAEEEMDEDKYMEKTFNHLQKEIKHEEKTGRQSLVGMSSLSSEQSQAAQEEFVTNKENVTKSVKEYLMKAGHHRALGFMSPQHA